MMRKLLFLGVAAVPLMAGILVAGSAAAADLSEPVAPPPYQPIPGSAPILNWTGFYAGVQGGYGFGSSHAAFIGSGASATDTSPSGWVGGGQVGYNWELPNNVVLGIEGDWVAAGLSDSVSSGGAGGGPVTITQKIGSIGAVKGRLGYASGRWMPYLTGGWAFGTGTRQESGTYPGSDDSTHSGYIVGAGVEYAMSHHWSVRGEYDYVDLGKATYDIPGPGSGTRADLTANLLTVGLNYRF